MLQLQDDVSRNFKHLAMAQVRQAVCRQYGEVGSVGAVAIVDDKTYRDKDGMRMADERFQACIAAYYIQIRRVKAQHLPDVQDLGKLEFTLEELALVDLEVGILEEGDLCVNGWLTAPRLCNHDRCSAPCVEMSCTPCATRWTSSQGSHCWR